jgi:hypothetical protein
LLFIAACVPAATSTSQQWKQYASQLHLLSNDTPKYAPNLKAFSVREELVYEVSYMGIGLGTVTSRVVAIDTGKGRYLLKAECLIRSYKGVPFVTLNTVFQSTMDRYCSSVSFASRDAMEDTTHKYVQYEYTPRRDALYVFERLGNKALDYKYDTLSLDGLRWQDGLSLLFYARAHARQRFKDKVPVLMYKDKSTADIHFGIEREAMDIDKVDYEIKTVKLEGESKFTGIFGLTGDFEGWFSDDYAAVPIYAKMHVIIGSIRLELIRWKKPGWKPPRYED